MPTIDDLLARLHGSWDDPDALGALGRELHDRNRLDIAQRVLERVVELDPARVEDWAHLAYCHFRSMRADEGRAVLRQAIEATRSELG